MAEFKRAERKLEEARICLESLKQSQNAVSARTAFCSFVAHYRAVTYALQKDGAHVQGFAEWYGPKQTAMRGDQLLRYFHDARVDDFHKGEELLGFTTTVYSLGVPPPPTPGAELMMGGEGPFWVVNRGTSDEHRIPVQAMGEGHTRVYVKNPPREHKGQVLTSDSPVELCVHAFHFMAELLHEARAHFAVT
jgi:hypothetical protein